MGVDTGETSTADEVVQLDQPDEKDTAEANDKEEKESATTAAGVAAGAAGAAGATATDDSDETELKEVPVFTLPGAIARVLKQDATKVWTTDYAYFEGLLALEIARKIAQDNSQQLQNSYYTLGGSAFASLTGGSDSCHTKGRRLGDLLNELILSLQARVDHNLREMAERPLVEKLMDAVEATEIQRKVFRCVLARASELCNQFHYATSQGVRYQMSEGIGVSLVELADLFADDLSLTDLVEWTDATSSVLVKEQIYRDSASLPAVAEISAMDQNTIGCLMGLELKLSQYQAIASSLLQKILMDHTPFLETKTGKLLLSRKQSQQEASENTVAATPSAPSALVEAFAKKESAGHLKKDRLFDVLSTTMAEEKLNEQLKRELDTEGANEEKKNDQTTVVQEQPGVLAVAEPTDDLQEQAKDEFGPYKTDLEYLEDQVILMEKEADLIRIRTELKTIEDDDENDVPQDGDVFINGVKTYRRRAHPSQWGEGDATQKFRKIKEAEKIEQRVKQLTEKATTKMSASRLELGKFFRLEQLCQALDLCTFEKRCILAMVKSIIMPNVGGANGRSVGGRGHGHGLRSAQVGSLIEKFCSCLADKMNYRSYFYKSSALIQEGILTLTGNDFLVDISECRVELDRRLFDYIVGLDTEMSELVDGSHLYLPNVSFEDVVLPAETKKRIGAAVLNFDKTKDAYLRFGVEEKITYGLAQILLFYGHSGTGKTMLANALATKMNKKLLLVNFPDIGHNQSGAIIKFLFREARITRSLLFFDECESLFRDRKMEGSSSVNMILTELERFDGICILATNRACDLDEAMYRRISLAIEFRKPDHIMREQIWKTLQPPKLPLDEGISFSALAKKYELVGGTIKNAWLQTIHIMVQRGGTTVSQEDLESAASEQVRGALSLENFDRRVVPTAGVDQMVLEPSIKEALTSVVQYSKAQAVLFGQWGFEKLHRSTTGISVLFTGKPGTGKSMAAEAIGFDLGKPLLVVNVAELVSKWVGETGKNIQSIFADAKKKEAVLVFDEAEGLFGSRSTGSSTAASRHDTMNVGLLLQYVEEFPGICVVITNMKDAIDEAFFRRFRFVLDFQMPSASDRELIWKSIIPEECPLAPDVRLGELASRFEMCGGDIKNALLRAATNAALRSSAKHNLVTMEDLKSACTAEMQKRGSMSKSMEMYS